MAKSIDYTGETLGRLFVIGLDHRGIYGGKACNFWLCQCECGRKEVIPQTKLIRQRRECAVCQRGPCVVCGKPIENERPMSNTCSDDCEVIKRRRNDNLHYAKKTSEDPSFNKRRGKARMESIKADPKKYAAWREQEKLRSSARRRSPENNRINELARQRYEENREAILARRRELWSKLSPEEQQARIDRQRKNSSEWYQNNKDRVRANNRARWNAMTDEEKADVIQRFRAYHRKAARKKMAVIYSDADLYASYLEQQRRYTRRRAARLALEKLLSDPQKLLKAKHEPDSEN